MGKMPNKTINQRSEIQILEGKLRLNGNALILSAPIPELNYSNSRPIHISLGNLIPIPMGIPREEWESHISHSHTHLYAICFLLSFDIK